MIRYLKQFFSTQTLSKLILIHGVIFLIRGLYLLLGPFELFSEEAQYWVWSQKLDLSYYSKPPLIAYINFISTSIFGNNPFAIKFNALSFGLASTILTYQLAFRVLKEKYVAVLASFLVYALPFHHTVFNIFLTDAPLCFFWGLSLYLFWEALEKNQLRYWVWLGIGCGLGFLSKYTMVFFAPFTLVVLASCYPEVLKKKGLYVAIAIAGIFTLPVIIWNYQLDFVTVRHVSSIGSSSMDLPKRLAFVGEYLGGQIGFLSPLLLPFLLLIRKDKLPRRAWYFLLSGPILVFLFFLFYSLTRRIEVNWTVFAYFPVPILMAQAYFQLRKPRTFHIATSFSLVLILLLFYFTPFLYPLGLDQIIPPKRDPAARLMGWRATGEAVENQIGLLKGDYFLFSESYHTASATAFFTRDQEVPIVINLGRRKNQYDLWPGIAQFEGSDHFGIFVTRESSIPAEVLEGFEEHIRTDTVKTYLGGEVVKQSLVATFRSLQHIEERTSQSF